LTGMGVRNRDRGTVLNPRSGNNPAAP
jgi:hypothetical protein